MLAACRRESTSIAKDPVADAAPPAPSPKPPPSPEVEVHVHADAPSNYAIEVANVGAVPASVDGRLLVEVLGDAGWTNALPRDRTLSLDCKHDACRVLAAGETVKSPPWTATIDGCMVQDDCWCTKAPCTVDCPVLPAHAGKYRVVAQSCDGKTRWESAAFDVPP